MEITEKFQNGVLTLCLDGRIDTTNAKNVEEEIDAILAKYTDYILVLDADKLEYLSSVGLRVVLRLKKLHKELKIINVSNEVYDIFSITGFTEMMEIQKAYRKLSVEGCEVIGSGSNGVVYRLDSDTIIKVYRNPDSLPDIHKERELARKAFVLGIPTAIPYDVVKVGDSYGSVFELLDASSLSYVIAQDKSKIDYAIDEYVSVLKQLHSTELAPGEIPEMKPIAIDWANYLKGHIPDEQYEKLIKLIDEVPNKNTLIHGDFHLNNLMVQNGEVLLIDMDTLCTGHPVFELGSVFLAYQGFSELDHTIVQKFHGFDYDTATYIWKETLKKYFGIDDQNKLEEYENMAKVISYTRLLRRTLKREPDNIAVIENCKNKLSQLLKDVNSLVF